MLTMSKYPRTDDAATSSGLPPGRRTVLRLASAAAVSAGAGLIEVRGARAATARTLRYAHSGTLTHPWQIWGEAFKASIEKKTDGRITVAIFPNAELGNEKQTLDAVRLGTLDMGAVGAALQSWVPAISITDAPYLFLSRQQCYAAIDGALGDDLKKRALAKGVMIAGWTDLGLRVMTNNKHQIYSVKDMKGLKMRVPQSKSYIVMMEAFGSSVIAVELSELYLALRQGLADGQDTPPAVIVASKFYEVQKYLAKTDHMMTTAYAIANPHMFGSLSAPDKEAFQAAAQDATDRVRVTTVKDEAAAFPFCAAKGMEINSKVDIASFRAACAGLYTKYPDLFVPELVKLARSAPA